MTSNGTVGIIGGGQLGLMLARASLNLGIRCHFLDPNEDAPAGLLAQGHYHSFKNLDAFQDFLEACEVATYEFENVDLAVLRSQNREILPSLDLLEKSQDRVLEKQMCQELGFSTANFLAIDSREDYEKAGIKLGYPFLLKTRSLGYDGKGQYWLHKLEDSEQVPFKESFYVAEGQVPFDFELSIAAVRGREGSIKYYPLSQNWHSDGILRESAPFRLVCQDQELVASLQKEAERIVRCLLEKFEYIGVLTVEFFLQDNFLIVNEIAPRVHNSYHWTLQGSETNQFENHMRAISGLPLGGCETNKDVRLFNCIGGMPDLEKCLAIDGLHYYSYHKLPREGRKMGHLILSDPQLEKIEKVRKILSESA